jgi:lysophospholipase L1-like esterase
MRSLFAALPAFGLAMFTAVAACSGACSSAKAPVEDEPTNTDGNDGGASTTDGGTSPAPVGDSGGPVDKAPLHFIGRFDMRDAKGPRASWPGSEIRLRFSGTGATLRIHGSSTGNALDQLDVSIDGAAPTLLKLTDKEESYPIATGLADGEHDVVITKRTESFGTIQFLGLDSTENRPIVPSPVPFKRWIEFIGDSITCGYGVLGKSASCSFSADTENEALAYGALTASALSAGHSSVAFSGIGIYRNSAGKTEEQMPVRFFRTLANDATAEWDFHITPDVVVINLGTNDFTGGAPSAEYEKAYTEFLTTLRTKYTQAYSSPLSLR